MPSPIAFSKFKALFKPHGVSVAPGGKGSHFKMKGMVDGKKVVYIIAVHRNKVDGIYLEKARRAFRLTEDDGLSDKEFFGRKK